AAGVIAAQGDAVQGQLAVAVDRHATAETALVVVDVEALQGNRGGTAVDGDAAATRQQVVGAAATADLEVGQRDVAVAGDGDHRVRTVAEERNAWRCAGCRVASGGRAA